jgi:hypothetical protein
MLKPILIGVAVLGALYILDRLLLWMESKGWVYWRRAKGRPGGAMTGVFLSIQEMVQPGALEAAEHRAAKKQEQDDSGAPLAPESDNDESRRSKL